MGSLQRLTVTELAIEQVQSMTVEDNMERPARSVYFSELAILKLRLSSNVTTRYTRIRRIREFRSSTTLVMSPLESVGAARAARPAVYFLMNRNMSQPKSRAPAVMTANRSRP